MLDKVGTFIVRKVENDWYVSLHFNSDKFIKAHRIYGPFTTKTAASTLADNYVNYSEKYLADKLGEKRIVFSKIIVE